MKDVHVYKDIELAVRVWMEGTHAMKYEVFDIEYFDNIPDPEVPKFCRKGATSNAEQDLTTNFDDAEVLVSGSIKWDGCSHNDFSGYYHGCGRQDLTRFGVVFDRLFDLAGEKMPDSKGNLT